jgi:DNA-binding NarL/FixJ family response regulator
LALVVEDDAGWRDILAELIAEAGYQAVTCRGFAEALGHLGRAKFALALVDLSLRHAGVMSGEGELSGQHLLSTAQAMGIPTIVVSGVSSPTLIEATFRRYGVFAWLEKQSFERRAFLDIVRSLQEDGQPARELADLTEREYQVLKLLVEGHSNQEIADILIVSINTVKQHLKAIYKKLDVSTRSAAVSKALVEGLQQSGNNK